MIEFIPLTGDTLLSMAGEQYGDPRNERAFIAEAIRAEISGRLEASRRSTCDRVIRLLAPVLATNLETVKQVCDELERIGDITAGSNGRIAATPLRAIDLGGNKYALASSLPTVQLAALLGTKPTLRGAQRSLEVLEPVLFAEQVKGAAGTVISVERWSGFDLTLPAGDPWLDVVRSRFANGKLAAAFPGLEWHAYKPAADTLQFQRWSTKHTDGALWRGRDPFGWWNYAWCEQGTPEDSPYLRLTGDEALRTQFAIDRAASAPLQSKTQADGNSVRLDMAFRLPRAEYRYLLAQAEATPEERAFRVPVSHWPFVKATLTERLGLSFTEE